MNIYNIKPCQKKLLHLRTVAFFPRYHPNVDLLVRRFADAYYNLFIVRFLDKGQLPPPEFYKGWNIVIVSKILDKVEQQKLNELVWTPPMFIYFKDWLDPTFPKIVSPWTNESRMTLTEQQAKPVAPKIAMQELEVVASEPVVKDTQEVKPKVVEKKPRRPVNANVKKEVISVALRTSDNLKKVSDEDLLTVMRFCRDTYPTPRVKQAILVKHVLKDIFKQGFLRDPDIAFVNSHIVARMVTIRGVKYSRTACGFELRE